MDRREALSRTLRAGLGAAALPVLGPVLGSVLGGCQSTGTGPVDRGQVGRPIPEDPTVTRAYRTPVARPASSPQASMPLPRGGYMQRTSWTRQQPRTWLADPMNGVHRITVHHDGMPPVAIRNTTEAAARIEQIRSSHVDARHWADIGYHYVVDPNGNVWQGRPIHLQGAHVKDQNEHNLGIVVLGNFEEQTPTPQALASLDQLIAGEMRRYSVRLDAVRTHQEYAPTACPGRNLQRYMNQTRARGGRLQSFA